MWPESSTERARGALYQLLYTVRQALGEESVVGADALRLDATIVSSDVSDFQAALGRGDLIGAVGFYRGPFLDAFHLSGAPELERWIEQKRRELAGSYQAALSRLAVQALERRNYTDAIRFAECLVLADPLSDRATMLLMEALAGSGDVTAALERARVHASVVRQELGPDVDANVGALAERLRTAVRTEPYAMPGVYARADTPGALEVASANDPRNAAPRGVLLRAHGMLGKALAVYAGAIVAVAVFAKAATVGIGLPDWVLPGALVVMGLGLPVILFTAYAQDIAGRALIASAAFVPSSVVAKIAMKASPHVSWRRATLGGLYAVSAFVVAVGVFMLLRSLGIGPPGSLLAAGKFTTRQSVLIADFAVANADSALGPVVSDAVRAGLSESPIISLVSPERVAAVLRRMERSPTSRLDMALAREVAQREGVKAVVDGDLTEVAGAYILALRLVTADSAVELASFREVGDGPRGLIDAADRVARRLRSKIGESLRTVHASPELAEATTHSLAALRKFSAAQRANTVEGQYAKAVALARDAVGIDSTFAAAWSLLSFAMYNADMPHAPQDSAMERAYRYSDRLTEHGRLFVLAAYYQRGPHRDPSKAVAAYELLLRNDEQASANNLGLLYSRRGEFAHAESLFLRDVRRDSSRSLGYTNAVDAQLNQGKLRQAEATLTLAQRRFPGNINVVRRALSLRYAQGDLSKLEREVDSLSASPNAAARAYGLEHKAALARLHGRYAESKRWDREVVVADSAQGRSRIAAVDALNELYVDTWFHGPSDRVINGLDATLTALPVGQIAPADRPYFLAARAYALAGRADRGRLVIEQFKREVTDTAQLRLQESGLHMALAEIALAEHRPAEAAVEFRREDSSSHGFRATPCANLCFSLNLGRAFDLAEMSDSAIAMYERYLATPHAFRLLDIDQLALAGTHKRLGELYEARGERQKAALHYRQFVELWKNADQEFQPRVDEVKRRLTRLSSPEKR